MARTQHERLIQQLQRDGCLTSHTVTEAFRAVPRQAFVPEQYRDHAYSDTPLPISHGQTISAPHMVAIVTELVQPHPADQVLEIGAGSGYQAAILAQCVSHVTTIERHAALADRADRALQEQDIDNVTVITGDGSQGYWPHAPYTKILATAAAETVPDQLHEQLAERGRIVVPVQEGRSQRLYVGQKDQGHVTYTPAQRVAFVPLVRDT